MVGYTGQEGATYNPLIGCGVLAAMVLLTVVLIVRGPSYDEVMAPPKNKQKSKSKGRGAHELQLS